MPRPRRAHLFLPLVLALILPGCEDDTPDITGALRAVILVTVEPNPVPGIQNPLTGSVSASYVVKIQELAGLGGDVEFVSSAIFDPASGQQVALNYFDTKALQVFVGSGRIEAGETLLVPQTLSYVLPDFTKAASLVVTVQVKDDRDSIVYQSLLVPIQ
jgi:hypothetical protein